MRANDYSAFRLCSFIFTISFCGRCRCHSPFTDGEPKGQRGSVTCPKPHSEEMKGPVLKLGSLLKVCGITAPLFRIWGQNWVPLQCWQLSRKSWCSWASLERVEEVWMEQNPGGRVRGQPWLPPISRSFPECLGSLEEDSPSGPGLPWVEESCFVQGPCSWVSTHSKRDTDTDMRQDMLSGPRLLATEFWLCYFWKEWPLDMLLS